MTHRDRVVLYVVDVDEFPFSDGCRVEAWRPPGIDQITEVFHARMVGHGYPTHCHDTWTVLIVDRGAIAYDLDRRKCGAVGQTVAILPPGVTHNGKPARGADSFVKRVLYLDESALPIELIGAAVDRTNICDAELRHSIAALHDELVVGSDPFMASSALALIVERIAERLAGLMPHALDVEAGVARQLRLMLDEPMSEPITLDAAAQQLQRSKAHLIRSFTARYGLAPHAYLIGKRVDAARKLLLRGMRPADVAATVGFYDQAHLNRHFKRHTSIAPAAYAASRPSAA